MAANAARRQAAAKRKGKPPYITFLSLGKPIVKQETRQHIAGSVEGKHRITP